MKRLYRFLLRLYPARFREEYSGPLERQFRDEYRELDSAGARARFWLIALADLAVSIPAELAREIAQDLRFGARVYRRRKFATALTLAALALAIGASTGVFSVLNALLLRGLPFEEPERLVELWLGPLSPFGGKAAFERNRQTASYLDGASAFSTNEMSLARAEGALQVRVTESGGAFFDVLGVRPRIGRTFAPGEDERGANHLAVLSHKLWQQGFGGDPRVLGSQIRVNGVPLTVIGVAPAGFDYPAGTSLWTPTVYSVTELPKTSAFGFDVVGRLKPGVSIDQARADFLAVIERDQPKRLQGNGRDRPALNSLRDQLAGPVRDAALVLLGVVGFVLLIACANVAQLLLSRVTERRQELAVRAAMGASRARLTQQLITEAVLLTMGAAAAGLLVARWTAQLAATAQPAPLETQSYAVLDWPVVVFALALAMITGLLFGVLPALAMGRTQPAQEIVRTHTGASPTGASRMRFALVALQAALTVMLVGGAITMVRGFQSLIASRVWYRPAGLVSLDVSLAGIDEARRAPFLAEALGRLRSIPGVESAGAVNYAPTFTGMFSADTYRTEDGRDVTHTWYDNASPDYFRTIGTALVAGRDFNAADATAAEPVVIVNEAFMRAAGMGPELVGQTITRSYGKQAYRVVGIVRTYTQQEVFFADTPLFATIVARVPGDPADYLPVARDVVRDVDRDVPVYDVKTMQTRIDETTVRERFYTTATTFLAGFALLLAAIGVYGTASYAIGQRTKEIGVRIAVGAPVASVRVMLARESLVPLALGLAAGVGGALWTGAFLKTLLYSADPVGAASCAAAAAVLLFAGGVAVWRATAKVVRIDPMQALRAE